MKNRRYFMVLVIVLLPSMCQAGVALQAGSQDAWEVIKDFPDTFVRARVAPWGLRTKIGGGTIVAGSLWLWLAVQKWPNGKLLFLHSDERLSEEPLPYRTITATDFYEHFHFETPEFEITPKIPEGLYIIYEVTTTRPTDVFDESTWDTYPDSENVFIRSELNREEWESKGWTIIGADW